MSEVDLFNPVARAGWRVLKQRGLVIAGRRKKLMEWCDELGQGYGVVWDRLKSGWTPFEALNTPTHFKNEKAQPMRKRNTIDTGS